MLRQVEAIFRGGPADGRLMVVRDLRDVRFDQLDPDYRLEMTADAVIQEIPRVTYWYEPVRVVAWFETNGPTK